MSLVKRHKWVMFYLITILIFAFSYGALSASFEYEGDFNVLDRIYFSVVTITTLGYGEITPSNGFARLLVSFEALVGLFFLGMFLNGEAQNALDRRDKKYVKSALNHSLRMLSFVEEYFDTALGDKTHLEQSFKDKFESIASKLKYQPEIFEFNQHILDNIYWGARHAVNDFRLMALESKALSDDAFVNISAIITTLEFIENAPIAPVTARDPNLAPETMQHKASIAFTNAMILSKYLDSK